MMRFSLYEFRSKYLALFIKKSTWKKKKLNSIHVVVGGEIFNPIFLIKMNGGLDNQ